MAGFTRWMPPLAWMGVIFLSTKSLAAQETSRFLLPLLRWLFPDASEEFLQGLHFIVRKLGHLLEYAILSYLWTRTLDRSSAFLPPPSPFAFLLSISYAAVDEFHQAFVPTRTADLFDVLLDASGAALFQGFLWVWSKRREQEEGRKAFV
ncbi:MAG: VanZ family protein [candidate division NC10 bacterium]|nr:VanZ family protein [candidate division NC10 bacterium]